MNRAKRRALIDKLSTAPPPRVPDGLAKRIQAEIPEDLFPRSASADDDSTDPAARGAAGGRQLFQVAAALFLVAATGYIALQLRSAGTPERPVPAGEPVAERLAENSAAGTYLDEAAAVTQPGEFGASRFIVAESLAEPLEAVGSVAAPQGEPTSTPAVPEAARAKTSDGSVPRAQRTLADSLEAVPAARGRGMRSSVLDADSAAPDTARRQQDRAAQEDGEVVAANATLDVARKEAAEDGVARATVSRDASSNLSETKRADQPVPSPGTVRQRSASDATETGRLVFDLVERVGDRLHLRGKARPGTRLEIGDLELDVTDDGIFDLDLPWPEDAAPEIRVVGANGEETVEAVPLPD